MANYIKTFRTLVTAGYRRDKALLAVSQAFALSPEQIVRLDKSVK